MELGEVDHLCQPVEGKMKVCNANFGETGWLGVNEILSYENGFIISSVAKMNEYYLKNAEYVKRQFTICHEMGHGFGLPHTDEDFKNADLGNCMDYTDRPENNLKPDVTNFNRLASIYGVVNEERNLRATSNGNRNTKDYTIPLDVAKAYDSAMDELHNSLNILKEKEQNHRMMEGEESSILSSSSWSVFHDHKHGRGYERRLTSSSDITENDTDKSYILKVNMLFDI